MSHTRYASGWAAIAVSLITIGSLFIFAGGVMATQPEGLHCPDGWMAKDDSGADDNDLVLEAGLYICVKAGSPNSNEAGLGNTGIVLTDGDTTLREYLAAAGIVGGDGAGRDVSYWVEYPTLTIEKVTSDETDLTFPFTGTVDDLPLDAFALAAGASKVLVGAGEYTVTEGSVEGWTLADLDCDTETAELVDSTVSVSVAMENVTCTFTNEMVPVERSAALTVVKDAGENTTEEFEFYDGDVSLTGGQSFSMEFIDEDFDANDQVVVDVWESLSDEQVEAGWELVDIDCGTESFEVADDGTLTVTLDDQDDVTCTFTNELAPVVGAQLTLEKVVAGAAQNTTEFGFTLGGAAIATTVSEADAALSLATVAGSYVIGESAMTGWTLSGIECTGNATAETVDLAARTVSVTVANGESVVCTFSNTPQGGGVLPGNPTPKPSPKGAVLPSTAMPVPGLDVTLIGTLFLLAGTGFGAASLIERRRR